MNIPQIPQPRRRFLTGVLSLAALVLALPAAAETYLQKTNHNGSGDWTVLSHWRTSGGVSPTAISSTDDYVANTTAWFLRTPSGTSTFGGKSLTVGPATHSLVVRSWTSTATVPNLVTLGAAKVSSGNTHSNLAVTAWHNASGTTGIVNHTHASALFPLTIGTLTGSGDFLLTAGSATALLKLTVADAHDYLGTITLASGRLEFMNAVSSAGALVVDHPGDVTLDHAVTFTGLTVGATTYPPGTYSADDLGFVGTGSVTVRTSQTWYLTTKQSGSQNWTEAFLSNWNSQPNNSGVAPPSINIFDDYVSQVAGGELRTLNAASTFGGGSLTLANTTKLTVRTPAGAVSTIPVLVTSGTPTIANGIGTIRQNLAMGDWEIWAGTTKLSATAGRSLGFDIEYLIGSGTLQTQDGGAFYLSLVNGSGYTGNLNHASGSLRFEGTFSTQGAFTVGSTATVHLDQPAYFTSFSVAGSPKAAGFHRYSTLNAAHPLQFPSGSASGLVGIYTPDTTGPAHMFGVNLAGAESRDKANFPGAPNHQWIYPSAASFNYYHEKGLNLIRIPFRWERMQTSLGSGVLNAAELTRMDTVVGYAAANGMKVILDMHNYARWVPGSNHDGYLIGTGPVTLAHFGEVWRLLADHYKGNSTIYGYGIMNEPHGTNGTWPVIAQTAVDAIRTVDLGTYVIVGGDHYSNAHGWRAKNPNLDIKDPVGRLIYEAHCYFDANNTGQYNNTYDGEGAYPMVGVDRVTEFVEWLQERGAKGFLGEYGVPGNDSRWLTVLDNFLAYLDANGVSGTYWAGGPWWGTYPLSCEPTNNYTTDKPQMTVLENYN